MTYEYTIEEWMKHSPYQGYWIPMLDICRPSEDLAEVERLAERLWDAGRLVRVARREVGEWKPA